MLDAKVAQLLNEQVNKEFYSAYLYLDFSIYYEEEGLDEMCIRDSAHPAQPGGGHLLPRPPHPDDPALGRHPAQGDREGHPDL